MARQAAADAGDEIALLRMRQCAEVECLHMGFNRFQRQRQDRRVLGGNGPGMRRRRSPIAQADARRGAEPPPGGQRRAVGQSAGKARRAASAVSNAQA